MVVCESSEILPEHLPATVRGFPKTTRASAPVPDDLGLCLLDKLELAHIRRALRAAGGHRDTTVGQRNEAIVRN